MCLHLNILWYLCKNHGRVVSAEELFETIWGGAWEETYLAGRIEKGRMTAEQVAEIKERFSVTDSLKEAVSDADIVIEAIIEQKDAKANVLGKISRLVRPDTLIATNSSFMVSSTFKDAVVRPERLANLHYFMPALVMELVEVGEGNRQRRRRISCNEIKTRS